jgi:hypothetical protein
VGETIEQRTGEPLRAEDGGPLLERQVGDDQDRATLVALAEDLEQQLGASRSVDDPKQISLGSRERLVRATCLNGAEPAGLCADRYAGNWLPLPPCDS